MPYLVGVPKKTLRVTFTSLLLFMLFSFCCIFATSYLVISNVFICSDFQKLHNTLRLFVLFLHAVIEKEMQLLLAVEVNVHLISNLPLSTAEITKSAQYSRLLLCGRSYGNIHITQFSPPAKCGGNG